MERCAVVGGDMVCVGIAGHIGPCITMTREKFEAALKHAEIAFLYGSIDNTLKAQEPQQSQLDTYVRGLQIPIYPQELVSIARRTGKQNLNNLRIKACTEGLLKP